MPRSKSGSNSRKKEKKIFRAVRGYWGGLRRVKKTAKEAVLHAFKHAYNDRRDRRQEFRALWITRINAACRLHNTSYSQFINALKVSGIEMNRKMLSEMAIHDPEGFKSVVQTVSKNATAPKSVLAKA